MLQVVQRYRQRFRAISGRTTHYGDFATSILTRITYNLRTSGGWMMQILRDRISKDGKYLGNGILKVDAFMNHQIDPLLMKAVGEEFGKRFANVKSTSILTAE